MGKFVKVLLLVIVTFGFMVGIVNAQSFWVKFIDANGDGSINFTATAYNTATQSYSTGVADISHTIFIPLLQIPAGGSNSTTISWKVAPGGSLIYDIYLTPDKVTYYWTSKGDAVGSTTGATLSIDWLSGSSNIPVYNFNFSSSGDAFQIVPVPIPSSLWLFASGMITLLIIGFMRKRLSTC